MEIRIPWQLLNFYDPSQCTVIDDYQENSFNIQGIAIDRIYAAAFYDDQTNIENFGACELEGWKTPQWHERLKESYYMMKEVFGNS